MTAGELARMVEALLFASPRPMAEAEMVERLPKGGDLDAALGLLAAHYDGRGVRLVRVAGGWAFRTAEDLRFLLAREVVETRKLSRAGVETLAVIAYHGPATRAEIEDIRGVSISRGTLDQLVEMGWVRLGRRRQTPGRPVTYIVTESFLDHFGLAGTGDLPNLDELRAAGFLAGPGGQGEPELPLPPGDAGG